MEFLLMLTLLSFFLGVFVSFSVCWLEDEDEEELVLALESSSDIATPPPHTPNLERKHHGAWGTDNEHTQRKETDNLTLCLGCALFKGSSSLPLPRGSADRNLTQQRSECTSNILGEGMDFNASSQ